MLTLSMFSSSFTFTFSWVARADYLLSFSPILSIHHCHTNPLHRLFHYIRKSLLWIAPDWHLHIQHSLSTISPISPLHMSKACQPCLSNFVYKLLNLGHPADVLISSLVHSNENRNISSSCPLVSAAE